MPYVELPSGLRVHYRESGSGGLAVVLLHGNLSTSRQWERVMELLPQGLHAIAPDRRGAGESGRPEGPWSMADLAGDLHALTQALGLSRFTLVGHSFGGGEALQFAATWPDAVERLVLVNSPSPEGFGVSPERWVQYEALVKQPEMMKKVLELTMPAAPKDEFFHGLIEESVATALDSFLGNSRALEAMDATEGVRRLSAPVLVLQGRNDALITVAIAERLCSVVPNARLEVWDDIGHSAPMEAPERFARRLHQFMEV